MSRRRTAALILVTWSGDDKAFYVMTNERDPRRFDVYRYELATGKPESDEIVEAVKQNGVPVEYVVFDDERHGFAKKKNRIVGYRAILEFLDKYLKK